MELEKIKLTGMQEIQNIGLEPADNGGCVLRFTIHTPSKTYSESDYQNHTEVFEDDEIDTALERIKDLYRATLAVKSKGNASTPSVTVKED